MDDPQYIKEVHSILDKVKQSNALLRLQAASHPACYVAILIQSFHEKTGELVFKDAPKKFKVNTNNFLPQYSRSVML